MGCFSGCFRSKDSSSNIIVPRDRVVSGSKNSLSSLFLSDDDSLQKVEGHRDTLPQQSEVKQRKDEVKLVENFGTLLDIPTEIKKSSEKWKDIPAQSSKEKSSNLNSSHPHASSTELDKEKQFGESPEAVKICKEWVTGSDLLTESPSSCMTAKHSIGKVSSSSNERSIIQNAITPVAAHIDMHGSGICSETSSVLTAPFAPSVKSYIKPAQFDCESDGPAFSSQESSSECASQLVEQSELAGDRGVTNLFPFSVLRKSMDEMQALGDESPVDSVSQPVGDTSQLKELKDKSSSDHLREPLKMNNQETSPVTVDSVVKNCSVGNDMANEGSLSSWFKPISAEKNSNKKQFESVESAHCGKSSGDRPILGMVSAYWNEDDGPSDISPKRWDGNGIPNSTNKYKEDQKVSWNATSFEERLEKALSEDTSISLRKRTSGTPSREYHENEELDTALSHLQSSSHFKSVVTC